MAEVSLQGQITSITVCVPLSGTCNSENAACDGHDCCANTEGAMYLIYPAVCLLMQDSGRAMWTMAPEARTAAFRLTLLGCQERLSP